MSTELSGPDSGAGKSVPYRLAREQKGLHDQVWGYRVNALLFWIVLFHTSLLIPPALSWTLLFLGFSSVLALLVALVTIALSLLISLVWARHSYRKKTRWTATLHGHDVESPPSFRVVSKPGPPQANTNPTHE